MKESTHALFLRPLLFQETIIISVLIPIVVFFFRFVSISASINFLPVAATAGLAASFGLFVGTATKYYFIRPALRIVDKDSYHKEELREAIRSLSYLPLAEAVVTCLRFGLSGNLIATYALYLMDCISYPEFIAASVAVVMVGLITVPLIYLSSENSLTYFYVRHDLTGSVDGKSRVFYLSLSTKVLFTLVLIASPPLMIMLRAVDVSRVNGIPVASLAMGLRVLLIESLCLAVLSGILLMKNLRLSLERMVVMFKDMAQGQGDLTKRVSVMCVNEAGLLAFWFNKFMNDIEEIVGHVRETSIALHHTAEDVNEGSQGLSQETQEQAATMEQMSASINEMSTSIQKNAELLVEGRETSHAVTGLISQNKQVFADLMGAIREISMDSRKIGDIVSTVNEVAFHTNLLALNASVEAARAGEHGKGFAVVAGEVRSLAQRSSQAASEIKALIEGTVGRIKNGDDMMRKASSSLEELMNRMEFFFRMMEAIGSSSSDQTRSIFGLTRAVSQIDSSAQHSALTAQSLADTLVILRDMAVTLTQDVRKFKTSVNR
jgi:methyl-accepting chemotaxis protein